jgi:hemolysin activation/secretion protein
LISKKILLLAISLATFTSFAYAQETPDAGVIQKQIEDDRLKLNLPTKEEDKLNIDSFVSDSSLTVVIKHITYQGNTLIPSIKLDEITKPYLNRSLNFAQLEFITAQISEFYRAQGWVVKVLLPEQDLIHQTLTIEIIEASLGKVEIEDQSTNLNLAVIKPMIEKNNLVGSALNARKLDRALLLIDDIPGIKAFGLLKPGDEQKEADLKIKITNDSRLNGNVYLDNMGPRSTGQARIGTNFNINSPFKWGDQVNLSALHTHGSDYLRLAYSVPVGLEGLRIGLNGAKLKYDLISSDLSALQASGSFTSTGLEAQYPIVRSKLKNLYFITNFDRKDYRNEAQGQIVSLYEIKNISMSLYGNLFDNVLGGGSNAANLTAVKGSLDLQGSPTEIIDRFTTKSAGRFNLIRYAINREQNLFGPVTFYAGASGQFAFDNLSSSEKFYLGGPYGVRAYPVNEAGGSSGHLLKLELRSQLPYNFSSSLFYDEGHVIVNHNNNFIGASSLNKFKLKGAGLSLNWQYNQSLKISSILSRRIGENPNLTSTGLDQDGSKDETRFWINVSYLFQ